MTLTTFPIRHTAIRWYGLPLVNIKDVSEMLPNASHFTKTRYPHHLIHKDRSAGGRRHTPHFLHGN